MKFKGRTFIRCVALGVLLSMLFFYGIHVLGNWEIKNYQRDVETTTSIQLVNKCAVLGVEHILWPNTDVSKVNSSNFHEARLSGAFMNFFDGHILGMLILSLVLGILFYALLSLIPKGKVS